MNKLMRNTTWTTFGMMLALLTGAPAIADDTELLLVDPNNQTPKPNILMIIDSSGSMTTEEQTQLPTTPPKHTRAPVTRTCCTGPRSMRYRAAMQQTRA